MLKKKRLFCCNIIGTPLVVNEKLKRENREYKVDATYYRSLIGK